MNNKTNQKRNKSLGLRCAFPELYQLNKNQNHTIRTLNPSGMGYKVFAKRGAEGLRLKFLPQVLINIRCITIVRGLKNYGKR